MLTLLLKLGAFAAVVAGYLFLDSKFEKQKKVSTFAGSCKNLLAAIARHEPLTDEETRLIEHYCKELLKDLQRQHETSAPKVSV